MHTRLPLLITSGLLLWTLPLPAPADTSTVPARLIVKWKDNAARQREVSVQQAQQRFAERTGRRLQTLRQLDARTEVWRLETPPTSRADLETTLASLRSDNRIEYVVADERRHVLGITNDPLITASSGRTGQWYLNSVEPAGIRATSAWDVSQGGVTGNGVIVAVLDTGILTHPDLAGKVLPGFDFVSCDQQNCNASGVTYLTANDGDGWDSNPADPGDWINSTDQQSSIFSDCDLTNSSWHGTRVAGIIGAATNNALGIAGIGWNARILPVRVLGKCGGYDSDILAGMRWAAGLPVSGVANNPNPARVINLSLGSADICNSAYADTVNTLLNAGVTIVASAGNDGGAVNTPANCSGVIGVVGVRNVGSKVGFSSLGASATIAAPGGNCVNPSGACLYPIDTLTNLGTTVPTVHDYSDQTNPSLGTSFSAPIVSGTIALMLGANTNLTPAQIRTRLQASARTFPAISGVANCHMPLNDSDLQTSECNCQRATCGAGLTDALGAVQAANQPVAIYVRGPTAVTVGATFTLDAGGSTLNESNATYDWTLPSGLTAQTSLQGSRITLQPAGTPATLSATLTVNDGLGHAATQTHPVTIFSRPSVSVTGPNTVAISQSINLDGSNSLAADGGPLSYAWTVNSSAATLVTPTRSTTSLVAPGTATNLTVTLTVTDQLGGTNSQVFAVSVTGNTSSSSSAATSSAGNVSSGGGQTDFAWLLCLAVLWLMQCRRQKRSGSASAP